MEIRIHAFIDGILLVDSRLCIHLRDVFVVYLNNICLLSIFLEDSESLVSIFIAVGQTKLIKLSSIFSCLSLISFGKFFMFLVTLYKITLNKIKK